MNEYTDTNTHFSISIHSFIDSCIDSFIQSVQVAALVEISYTALQVNKRTQVVLLQLPRLDASFSHLESDTPTPNLNNKDKNKNRNKNSKKDEMDLQVDFATDSLEPAVIVKISTSATPQVSIESSASSNSLVAIVAGVAAAVIVVAVVLMSVVAFRVIRKRHPPVVDLTTASASPSTATPSVDSHPTSSPLAAAGAGASRRRVSDAGLEIDDNLS
jgi:hypothetical protein